jgi:hypothetical protein
VTAVTLPPHHQFEVLAVTPTAPVGPLPTTFEEWGRSFQGPPPAPGDDEGPP